MHAVSEVTTCLKSHWPVPRHSVNLQVSQQESTYSFEAFSNSRLQNCVAAAAGGQKEQRERLVRLQCCVVLTKFQLTVDTCAPCLVQAATSAMNRVADKSSKHHLITKNWVCCRSVIWVCCRPVIWVCRRPVIWVCRRPVIWVCRRPVIWVCRRPVIWVCRRPVIWVCRRPVIWVCRRPVIWVCRRPVISVCRRPVIWVCCRPVISGCH